MSIPAASITRTYSTPVSIWIILISATLILGSLVGLFTNAYEKRLTQEIHNDAANELSSTVNTLSTIINSKLILSNGLDAFTKNQLTFNSKINPDHFNTFAANFIGNLQGIRNLSIYPNGVAEFVYPHTNNESLLGLNLFTHNDPTVRDNAVRTKLSDHTTILGPLELEQGGLGIIARKSIYVGSQFWGFVSVVLDITPVLQEADLFNTNKGIDFAIRANNQILVGNPQLFESPQLLEKVRLLEGFWEIAAIPNQTRLDSVQARARIFQIICAFSVLLVIYFLYVQLTQKAKLRSLVTERTRKLVRTNRQLEATFKELNSVEDELREQLRLLENKEQTVRHMAYHDAVTGLYNRTYFNERLAKLIANSKQTEQSVAVLFLDLDHFKMVNDTTGHSYGDQLLNEVGQRLTHTLMNGETISRIGGDEFTIIVPNVTDIDQVRQIAKQVRGLFQQPFNIQDTEYLITTSIGVAIYPEHGQDDTTLMKNADLAMYRAKEEGKNQYRFYDRTLNPNPEDTVEIMNNLRRALDNDEFVVHYQPQIESRTGKMIGLEALIRWNNPIRGLIAPNSFIPIAEETGLIIPIGERLLQIVCAQSKAWQLAGYPPIRIAVNLSPRQFGQTDLADRIRTIVEEAQVDPKYLELEITESMAIKEDSLATLQELRALGFTISIDDFGTQYSSLGYLKLLPVNKIKIDRSFVHGINRDRKDEAIILAMLLIASRLDLTVIAEGVETTEQLTFLQDNNCHEIQGFIFHKPQPAEAIEPLLAKQVALFL
ncbi:EAL domain-containing protein [Cohnella sp. WQ 127256]|uniref:bifunctional diguanylate cyclase/phosphodiesterase n=1 Tax=Cohnella sp. WQ 127256 TaxID=2938790 RepID=UPI00211938B6|nr:EAL domain-containing protein [Cohnella sp. WQ 127256]